MKENKNLATFMFDTIDAALRQLKENDIEYRQKEERMWDIREKLEARDTDQQAKEFLYLENELYDWEHTAIYFRAVYDCIALLLRLGWLKKL